MAAFAFWAWRDLEPFLCGGLTFRTIRRYGTHRAEGGRSGSSIWGVFLLLRSNEKLAGHRAHVARMKNSRRFLSRPIRNARSCALKPRAVPSCHALPFPFPFLSQSHPLPTMAPPFFPLSHVPNHPSPSQRPHNTPFQSKLLLNNPFP